MATETELRFRIPARKARALATLRIAGAKAGKRTASDLVSTYFDTGKYKLKRNGLTLRVRHDGDKRVQTIKCTNPANIGRGEWETEIAGKTPDLAHAYGTPLEPFASKKLRRKLKPVFKTSVHRITRPVHTGRSEIELAIDVGRIVAGQRSSPVEEFELELKSGRPADLFRAAKAIGRTSKAELDLRTKSERGYDLADGEKRDVAFVKQIELARGMTVATAFKIIARATLCHVSENIEAVRSGDPDGIHQMRVGLRRSRAAISVFSKLLAGAGTQRIKSELKWLAGELAPAREIDVFVKNTIEPAMRDILLRRHGKAIKGGFSERRERAFARARQAVDSERMRTLLIDMLQWVESGQAVVTEKASTPIDDFAAHTLRRRIRKVRKKAPDLDSMSAASRHKLRIRVKKIRYAVGFFESLFPRQRKKQLARLTAQLKSIQDALGSLNDFVTHQRLVNDATSNGECRDPVALAYASGVVLAREARTVRPLVKIAAREARRLPAF